MYLCHCFIESINHLRLENSRNLGQLFRRFGIITIIAVYVLIAVGGIVRMTGSGMGCPDWPRCFGRWIPPTDVNQLPKNYKTLYTVLGKEIADFDAFKTWVEYLNRLLGVLIGLLIFITLISSVSYFRSKRRIFWTTFLAFVLVGFQGWLGSRVVATNLQVGMITLHMIVALLIVVVLIYAVFQSHETLIPVVPLTRSKKLSITLVVCLSFTLIQIILGTQVREAIDHVSLYLGEAQRERWISEVGISFLVHRSFSWFVLGINIYFVRLILLEKCNYYRKWCYLLIIMFVIEIMSGVTMNYWAIPKLMQPVHLTLASLIFGIQFLFILLINNKPKSLNNI